MTKEEKELHDGAKNVADELLKSDDEGHKGLGEIIKGLCSVIEKYELIREFEIWQR